MAQMAKSWVAFGCAALAVAGCDSGVAPLTPDTGVSVPPTTYYEHVRPILVENCTMCHVEGGIGPFPMTTYEEARMKAMEMEEETRLRHMPPFLADNSGTCNTWSNYRGLTDEEIATIGRWYEQGSPEGNPDTPAPTPVTLPTLQRTDLTLEMPVEYTVDTALDDDYRCFVVDVSTTAPVFVTGYDVMPGNVQRVHHIIVYNPETEEDVTAARALDAAEGTVGDGYTCFGAARVNASPMVLWAPGTGATMFPEDSDQPSGIRLEAGRAQIIQIHYNNSHDEEHLDAPLTDRSRIALTTVPDDCNVRPGFFVPMPNPTLELPPGQESVVSSYTINLQDVGIPAFAILPVYGVLPHMHTLGRSLTVERIDGEDTQCAVNVPRWDFHWQMAYFMNRPMLVYGTDSVRITCTYDTTSRTETVRWGEGTMDEMCIAFFYVVDPRGNCP